MQPLLKYFIELAISWKDYSTISHDIGKQVQELDSGEEHFHCEYLENDICKLWRIKSWRESYQKHSLLKEQAEKDRQERFRREEIIAKAKFRLMNKKINPLSEDKAMELIINILSGDEIYAEMAERLELSSLINKR